MTWPDRRQAAETWAVTDNTNPKARRDQQLVVLAVTTPARKLLLRLRALGSAQSEVYETEIELPEIDTSHPELERLWALARIDEYPMLRDLGVVPPRQARLQNVGSGIHLPGALRGDLDDRRERRRSEQNRLPRRSFARSTHMHLKTATASHQ